MKQKIPLPESEVIAGEEEEDDVYTLGTPNSSIIALPFRPQEGPSKPAARTVSDAMNMARAFQARGLWKRAVVVPTGLSDEETINPENWGLVVDYRGYEAAPLVVCWANQRRVMSDGSDLQVVFRGMSEQRFKDWFEKTTHGQGVLQT